MIKKTCILIIIFGTIMSNCIANNFDGPESVIYDTLNERFIVSNTEGNFICQIDKDWNVSLYLDSCASPRGLFINNNILFVACKNHILSYNLNDDLHIQTIIIPEAGLLNDITVDHNRNLYATDSEHYIIYKINLSTNHIAPFIDTKKNLPNGIFYQKKDKKIHIGYSKGDITLATYNLEGQQINQKNYNSYVDGIAINKNSELFYSDWNPAGIYKTQCDFRHKLDTISVRHNGPADISIVEIGGDEYLLVPNYLGNSVDIILLKNNTATLYKTIR